MVSFHQQTFDLIDDIFHQTFFDCVFHLLLLPHNNSRQKIMFFRSDKYRLNTVQAKVLGKYLMQKKAKILDKVLMMVEGTTYTNTLVCTQNYFVPTSTTIGRWSKSKRMKTKKGKTTKVANN